MLIAPDRSLEQRMTALERANEIRSKRAALKRDLKARRADLIPLLVDPPEWLKTAKVFAMLLAVPGYSHVKATKLLQVCRISPSKTFGGLSERQRTELASLVRLRLGTTTRGNIPPGRRDPGTQHIQALARSNEVRLSRAAIRRQVSAGQRTVVDVLQEMPACVESMTLFDLVACQYSWGAARTRRLLVRLGIPETKALGTLTQRQIGLVIDKIEEGKL